MITAVAHSDTTIAALLVAEMEVLSKRLEVLNLFLTIVVAKLEPIYPNAFQAELLSQEESSLHQRIATVKSRIIGALWKVDLQDIEGLKQSLPPAFPFPKAFEVAAAISSSNDFTLEKTIADLIEDRELSVAMQAAVGIEDETRRYEMIKHIVREFTPADFFTIPIQQHPQSFLKLIEMAICIRIQDFDQAYIIAGTVGATGLKSCVFDIVRVFHVEYLLKKRDLNNAMRVAVDIENRTDQQSAIDATFTSFKEAKEVKALSEGVQGEAAKLINIAQLTRKSCFDDAIKAANTIANENLRQCAYTMILRLVDCEEAIRLVDTTLDRDKTLMWLISDLVRTENFDEAIRMGLAIQDRVVKEIVFSGDIIPGLIKGKGCAYALKASCLIQEEAIRDLFYESIAKDLVGIQWEVRVESAAIEEALFNYAIGDERAQEQAVEIIEKESPPLPPQGSGWPFDLGDERVFKVGCICKKTMTSQESLEDVIAALALMGEIYSAIRLARLIEDVEARDRALTMVALYLIHICALDHAGKMVDLILDEDLKQPLLKDLQLKKSS